MTSDTTLTIIGNRTAAPELKVTPSGAAVANFTIASTPRFFDKLSNEWKDGEPLFMRCNIWKEAAENVANSLTKGSRVMATGRLKQRSWEKDGQKHTTVELEVDEIGISLKFGNATFAKKGAKVYSNGGTQQMGEPPAGDPWGADYNPPF